MSNTNVYWMLFPVSAGLIFPAYIAFLIWPEWGWLFGMMAGIGVLISLIPVLERHQEEKECQNKQR